MTMWISRLALLVSVSLTMLCQTVFAQVDISDLTSDQKFEILHYEPLHSMSFIARTEKMPAGVQSESWELSFEAFGRAFELLLKSNDRLIARLPKAQRVGVLHDSKLFRGEIAYVEDSWARLTQIGEKWSGMIWDGEELYLIDPISVIAPALAISPLESLSTLGIYRLSDTRDLGVKACGVGPSDLMQSPIVDYRALIDELQERVATSAQGASLNLDMAVVADVQFAQIQQNSFGISPDMAVIARINIVDGIFSEQVGVQINLVEIHELSQDGSLTSTHAETLLGQFGVFTNSSAFNHPGVAHLFTGRDLDDNTVGIAYVSSLCDSRFGVGVNEIRSEGMAGALVVAHEVGHNFGAPHDNEQGSVCASTPGIFLMNPIINGSDQFSQCSLDQIQPAVNNAPCITLIEVTQSDLQINLPLNPLNASSGKPFILPIEVANVGQGTATNVQAMISVPSSLALLNTSVDVGACSNNGAGQVTCDLGDVLNGVQRTIRLTLQGQTLGQFVSGITVSADNDTNPNNDSGQAIINIINGTPNVGITTPSNGSTFLIGTLISFEGQASDVEDGDLTPNLTWTSSVDGLIGNGGNFSTTLSQGVHTITAAVVDSGGLDASQVITVTVSENGSVPAPIRINFQPAGVPVPVGYRPDEGTVYSATRGYGWDRRLSTRDRDVQEDQRLDTFVFGGAGTKAIWRYDLPNGDYLVSLASGDASYLQGPHEVQVEGVSVISGVATVPQEFVTVTDQRVTVRDGALTIQLTHTASSHTMLNYIILTPVSHLPPPESAIRINFQPAGVPVPVGYRPDEGTVYSATRGYGWDRRLSTRDRDVQEDQRLDTFVFGGAGTKAIWRYDLSNGDYLVSLASGDASYLQGPHEVQVEGVSVISGVATVPQEFVTVTDQRVTVRDGALTHPADPHGLEPHDVELYHSDPGEPPTPTGISDPHQFPTCGGTGPSGLSTG